MAAKQMRPNNTMYFMRSISFGAAGRRGTHAGR